MTGAASEGAAGTPSNVPIPDPSQRTSEALTVGLDGLRGYTDAQFDVLRERLDGIDRATKLLNESMTRVPTDVQKEVTHLRELHGEKFSSIEQQFKERDTRSEREARDNTTAVNAAFAAQKEAAAKQDESNAKAIDKSEKATAEAIGKLAQLFETTNRGFVQQIDDIKTAVAEIRSLVNGASQNKQGGTETTAAQRANVTYLIGIVLFIITVAGFAIALGAKH